MSLRSVTLISNIFIAVCVCVKIIIYTCIPVMIGCINSRFVFAVNTNKELLIGKRIWKVVEYSFPLLLSSKYPVR
jgi:hypothetical protein